MMASYETLYRRWQHIKTTAYPLFNQSVLESSVREINYIPTALDKVMPVCFVPHVAWQPCPNPWSKVTSVTTKLPFAHEQAARNKQRICLGKALWCFPEPHLKNQSVDCSHIPKASHTLEEKYAGVVKASLGRTGKEKVEGNETVGTTAERGGGQERQSDGDGGMVFVNPPTSGFY